MRRATGGVRIASLAFVTACVASAVKAQPPPLPRWLDGSARAGLPGARSGHALAAVPSRNEVFLFGGVGVGGTPAAPRVLRDGIWHPWRWTGNGPDARTRAALVHDAPRARLVLFGGFPLFSIAAAERDPLGDTWAYDLVNGGWTRLASDPSSGAPAARFGHAMAFDPARDEIVLFGGFGVDGPRDDTWALEADSTWVREDPQAPPVARGEHGMAYETARQRIIMFGGSDGDARPFGDTWAWEGRDWVFVTDEGPAARFSLGIAHDPVRERTIVFGGRDAEGELSDTWELEDRRWTFNRTTGPIAARRDHVMTWDGARERIVSFGGIGPSGPIAATFEYVARRDAAVRGFGFGCGPQPQLRGAAGASPWAGEDWTLEVAGVPTSATAATLLLGGSRTTWFGAFALPWSLDALGMPGCNLYVQGNLALPMPVPIGATGATNLAVPVGFDFVGETVFGQAVLIVPNANAAGVVLSNALEGVVGLR